VHVIATAGHVDHGKSALVRALTGMEPDRWAEEIRRGMTIDLGYAWTVLPSGPEVAFVDVPGHERFMTNMLAGVGPAPAALLVVAADGGWAPQTAEHVAALDALGVRHAVVAVTRADLADPAPVAADTLRRLGSTTLRQSEAVAVSARTGAGLDDLRAALGRLAAGMPPPDTERPVRLWIDRSFAVKGFGTVVTGTLGAGRIAVGDAFELDEALVTVRGIETLRRQETQATAVARVALNLRSVPATEVRRGQALLTPQAWLRSATLDVRVLGAAPERLPRDLVAHIGSAAVAARARPLGRAILRLELQRPLPLNVGDRVLLRDPGLRRLIAAVVVIDPHPPPLTGRGASKSRFAALARAEGHADPAEEVARRGAVPAELLVRIGADPGPGAPSGAVRRGRWLVSVSRWDRWRAELAELVGTERPDRLVQAGRPAGEAARALRLPDVALLGPLVEACAQLEMVDGRVRTRAQGPTLRLEIARALAPILERLASAPFAAPEAKALATAGLGPRELAAAAAAGVVLRLPGDIVLAPDAAARAAEMLDAVPAPFTLSEARMALGTSRRVAVPLLEHLDRARITRRVDEVHRVRVR